MPKIVLRKTLYPVRALALKFVHSHNSWINLMVLAKQDKLEFGRQFQNLLHARNWSQSDLVREVKLVTGKGIGRDAVSTYVNGHSFPSRATANLLSKVIGRPFDEIFGKYTSIQEIYQTPQLHSYEPGRAWLSINRSMSLATATQIIQLLNQEDSSGPHP